MTKWLKWPRPIHRQAHLAATNNYSNPLLQINALSKSFQKHPPKKTCCKYRCSHNHGDCPAWGTICNVCVQKNHWFQQCRRSGRRHSLLGHTPSPRRPQQVRQRRPSVNKQLKQGKGGGGSQFNKTNPKKPGGMPKTHKAFTLIVTENLLSGPSYPPKVKYSGSEGTKDLSMKAGQQEPADPPKPTGEQSNNTFTCDALRGNGNEEYNNCNKKYKVYTDTDSDDKTEIITELTCKLKGNLFDMEAKVDLGAETNYIPLSHFRYLFPEICREDGKPKDKALKPILAQFEAYDSGILQVHRWIMLPTQDINRDKKFHPVSYYMVDRKEARILISHET